MLSITESIFDPLGLLGPIVLTGKLFFQEATARKIDWDNDLPNDLLQQWRPWVTSLHGVRELRFPRCLKPQAFDDAAIQLHPFSDASAQGYGCSSYLRCVNKYGQVHMQLIMSKNKVAPLKTCTLPRLELQAAVLSIKVDGLLKRELELPVIQTYFWSDSEIVLKYINNESRRFHVFVANRISFIRQHTDQQQWIILMVNQIRLIWSREAYLWQNLTCKCGCMDRLYYTNINPNGWVPWRRQNFRIPIGIGWRGLCHGGLNS